MNSAYETDVIIEVDGEKKITKWKYTVAVGDIMDAFTISTTEILDIDEEDEVMLSMEKELKKLLYSKLVKEGKIPVREMDDK